MRDVTRRIETYSFYDRSAISSHLEAMAAKGWQLERITSSFWYYRRAQPQKLRYAVTYYPSGSAFDPEPNPGLGELYELCEHAGWEYVTGFAEMNIFVNSRENPTPLETDPAVDWAIKSPPSAADEAVLDTVCHMCCLRISGAGQAVHGPRICAFRPVQRPGRGVLSPVRRSARG